MKTTEQLFKENENLIYKQAWHYTNNYNADFEDVKSQAYLIFCEAVDRFDESKNTKFTTFLYYKLKELNGYCYYEKIGVNDNYDNIVPKKVNIDTVYDIGTVDNTEEKIIFNQLVDILTPSTKRVVKKLIHGDFNKPYNKRPFVKLTKYRIIDTLKNVCSWKRNKAVRVVNELQQWYDNYLVKIIN